MNPKEELIKNEIAKLAKDLADPSRDIVGESRIKTSKNDFESRLVRNIERTVRAKHTTKCDWEHLEQRVIPAIQAELLETFKEELQLMPEKHNLATNENFTLTLSLWSRKRMLKKVEFSTEIAFDKAWEDCAAELLSRLPKMLWNLKKTYNSGKSEALMVVFEWLESVDSAPLDKVIEMVGRAKETGQVS